MTEKRKRGILPGPFLGHGHCAQKRRRKPALSREDRKMCRKIYWRTMTLSASYNYETMQALGFMYAMMPAVNRFYSDPDARNAALQRHNQLFNTTPTLAGIITGLCASMEKEASVNPDFDPSSINAVKVALMGPLAGIGDSLCWGTLRVISLGVGISLALTGSPLGALVHLLMYNLPSHGVRYYGVMKGYELGGSLLNRMSDSRILKNLTRGTGIVGMMTVGAMAVTLTEFEITKVITVQGSTIVIQEILDSLFPQLVPLLITLACYQALKKGVSPGMLMIGLLILGLLGKTIGLF